LNGRNQRLSGVWHAPDLDSDRAAVVAHGLLSSKDSSKHRAVCERLAAEGIAALRFDFAGRGESAGSFAELTTSGEVEDLRAAVTAARAQGVNEIALVGSSLGGAVSILLAAEQGEFAALVTMAAPARLPRASRPSWGHIEDPERGESLGPGFFADAARLDVAAAAARIRAPWLVLHGAADEVVPVADAHLLAASNPGARLVVHPHADHRFSEPEHVRWLVDQVTGFVG
jgi:dienelactone hydrolase